MSPYMMLPVLLLMSYIDMTNPDTIFYLRVAFIVSFVLTLAYVQFLKYKIAQAPFDPKPTIKVQETGKPEQMMNAQQYDQHEVGKMQTQILVGMVVVLLMHYKWEYVQPLFIQAVTGPMNVLTNNLSMIHVFNKPAEGDRARPFKEGGPFADLMKAFQAPEEEKPAVAKKEVRGKTSARADKRARKID